MGDRSKKVFLALTIIVPFMIYCVYYYSKMISNAPFKSTEFESFTFKYGTGDSLQNKYYSANGDYEYINSKDSLVKKVVRLNRDDMMYLHHKAAEIGLWNFPDSIVNRNPKDKLGKSLQYYISFKYKRKTKTVYFDTDYNGTPKLRDAAMQMVKLIDQTIVDAENRYKKK